MPKGGTGLFIINICILIYSIIALIYICHKYNTFTCDEPRISYFNNKDELNGQKMVNVGYIIGCAFIIFLNIVSISSIIYNGVKKKRLMKLGVWVTMLVLSSLSMIIAISIDYKRISKICIKPENDIESEEEMKSVNIYLGISAVILFFLIIAGILVKGSKKNP